MTEQTNEQIGFGVSPEAAIEQAPTPEQAPFIAPEKPAETIAAPEQPAEALAAPAVETAPAPVVQKSEMYANIDKILSQNLGELYAALNAGKQEKFRVEGERITTEIERLLAEPKPDVHKIRDLVSGWMTSLEGVSKYFLEEELKIKVGLLLQLKKDAVN